jgi:hypothetical protein
MNELSAEWFHLLWPAGRDLVTVVDGGLCTVFLFFFGGWLIGHTHRRPYFELACIG